MKKYILNVLIIFLITIQLCSCKKKEGKVNSAKYTIETKSTIINWTAYKTTDKVPVKGVFKTVEIKNRKTATNSFDAINELEFSIPVNSIDSKNSSRDAKIITSFFGEMSDTKYLKGQINLVDKEKGNILLTMNGITSKLPMKYTITNQSIEINATLNLEDWKSQLAIKALNKVCNEKHKGKDGISKTWNEVKIHVISNLKVIEPITVK